MDRQQSTEEILKAPTFTAYYQAAVAFCAFIEQPEPGLPQDFLLATRRYLVSLYDAASALPWVDLQSEQDYD